jgi:hypothetical protein
VDILALLKALSLQRRADSNGCVVLKTPQDSATKSTPNKTTPISGWIEYQQELLGL